MYKSELEAEGWTQELPGFDPSEGICSMCGKVEGHRTLQLRASELFPGGTDPGNREGK